MVRALPCHGRGCGFESRPFRQWRNNKSESCKGLAFLLQEGQAKSHVAHDRTRHHELRSAGV